MVLASHVDALLTAKALPTFGATYLLQVPCDTSNASDADQSKIGRGAPNLKISYLAEHQTQPSHDHRVLHVGPGLRMVCMERTIMRALDRIGREQLPLNKPVICR